MTERERLQPIRWLCAGLVASWTWKWRFFTGAPAVYAHTPLHDPFFPEPLQNLSVLVTAFCVPILIAFVMFVRPSALFARTSMAAFCTGSLVLNLHQGSYNDATFVTSLWASLWGLWYLHASTRDATELGVRAAFLAQIIVALLFFGGALGKLTPGYFDGSVLYRIYFEKRQHWSFAWLRGHLTAAELRYAATLYSRTVVGIEIFLATLPLWPSRLALQLALVALGMLVVLNNFQLLSVIGSLMTLCVVGLWLLRRAMGDSNPRPTAPEAVALSS